MIKLQNVSRSHTVGTTTVHALRNVTAEIPDGAFAFIVGPSGSGKSTLLYLIGALDDLSGGDIEVDGLSLNSLSPSRRDAFRRDTLGFIFQSFNLLPNLTAVENVLVPFLAKGVSRELRQQAIDLLESVGLKDRVEHRPLELSGGEQQRVAIARALLKDPKIILADEPTGELDSKTGAGVIECLRGLNQKHGATVVIVTHDQSYIEDGDVILEIRDGELIAERVTNS
jgi:putative ABC transport system ATP-binding protein